MRLANITWPRAQKYFEENDMVIVSIGSIECHGSCLLYTSPSPRDYAASRMPSSA